MLSALRSAHSSVDLDNPFDLSCAPAALVFLSGHATELYVLVFLIRPLPSSTSRMHEQSYRSVVAEASTPPNSMIPVSLSRVPKLQQKDSQQTIIVIDMLLADI